MIIFDMQMPNHALGKYHKIIKWEMTPDSTHAVINSYATDDLAMVSWQDTYTIPLEWKISAIDDIEYILTQVGAPMAGGSIVPDSVETLQSAQARKWAIVKIERDKRANGTLTTSLGPIQIDDKSVVALATAKRLLTDPEATVDWTMADNSIAPLTLADIEVIQDERADFVVAVHRASQALRDLINSAATIGEVEAIDVAAYPWPAPTVEIEDEAPSPAPDDETESPPVPEDGSEGTE